MPTPTVDMNAVRIDVRLLDRLLMTGLTADDPDLLEVVERLDEISRLMTDEQCEEIACYAAELETFDLVTN